MKAKVVIDMRLRSRPNGLSMCGRADAHILRSGIKHCAWRDRDLVVDIPFPCQVEGQRKGVLVSIHGPVDGLWMGIQEPHPFQHIRMPQPASKALSRDEALLPACTYFEMLGQALPLTSC